jgi:hypothetical protein
MSTPSTLQALERLRCTFPRILVAPGSGNELNDPNLLALRDAEGGNSGMDGAFTPYTPEVVGGRRFPLPGGRPRPRWWLVARPIAVVVADSILDEYFPRPLRTATSNYRKFGNVTAKKLLTLRV